MSNEKYRIVWRSEAYGIGLPAAYQANVRIMLPNGKEMWDFVNNRRLFKTMKAAQEACEKHQRLWQQVAEGTGIRKLEELFGMVPLGYPLWVKSKLNRNMYALLMDMTTRNRKDIRICDLDQDALIRISASFASGTEATEENLTLVSPVEEEDLPTTPEIESSSTLDLKLPAPNATAPAKVRKKRVAKPTPSKSKPTKLKSRNTKSESKSTKKPSPNSRKTRKTRSKN